jgi:hypothetical protein
MTILVRGVNHPKDALRVQLCGYPSTLRSKFAAKLAVGARSARTGPNDANCELMARALLANTISTTQR